MARPTFDPAIALSEAFPLRRGHPPPRPKIHDGPTDIRSGHRSLGGVPPPARPPTPSTENPRWPDRQSIRPPLSRRRSPSGEATHPLDRKSMIARPAFDLATALSEVFPLRRGHPPPGRTLNWPRNARKIVCAELTEIGEYALPTNPQAHVPYRLPTKSLLWITGHVPRLLRLLRSRPGTRGMWMCG